MLVLARAPARAADPSSPAIELERQAKAKLKGGDLEGALADALRAVELDPGDPRHYEQAARVYWAKSDFSGVEKMAREAVRRNARYAAGWTSLSQALGKQGRFADARDAALRAAAIEPSPLAWTLAAEASDGLGDKTGAESYRAKAAPARPRLARDEPHDSRWRCARPGVKMADQHWYALELKCLVEWLSDFGPGGEFAGKADEASYSKEESRAVFALGKIQAWLAGRHGSAAVPEDAKRASQQHYLSGVIFFQKGDYDKARKEWREAKRLDPDNADADAGLNRLQQLYGR